MTGVTKKEIGSLGATAFDDLSEVVTAVSDGIPAGARIGLVPEGPYTFARASMEMR